MKWTAIICVVGLTVSLIGCSSIAKEAYYTATGAEGYCKPIQPLGSLTGYDSFKVEPFTTRLSASAAPGNLVSRIVPGLTQQIVAMTILEQSGAKTLTIRGEVVYVHLQDMIDGMARPYEQMVCYVTFHDPSGQQLGWGVADSVDRSRIVGEEAGLDSIVAGLGAGIADALIKHGVAKRPEPQQ